MIDKYLIEDIEVAKSLNLLVGTRSKDIQDLKNKMAEKFFEKLKKMQTLKIFDIVEDTDMEVVCDDALIGSIMVIDKGGREVQYDIQLYYIIDNLGNYYITETELLGEVDV